MTASSKFDLDTLSAWIGREDIATDVASEELGRRLQATLSRDGDAPRVGESLPLLAHFCLCQPTISTESLGPDGHPKTGGFLPPVPLPRRMWAGGRLSFHQPLRVGEFVTRSSRIGDVRYRQGRSGALCFVTVSHRFEADGRLLIEEEQDIVYREASATMAAPAATAELAPAGRHQRVIQASSPLLFRYSALTFNSHRIHYDRRYSMEEEGYPGLVVHGPLQATLLVNFAAGLKGRTPKRFEFRSLSPLFDLQPMLLNASEEGEDMELWTAHPGGPVAMTAKALF